LEEFDHSLPDIMKAMKPDDLLIISADHGCDPTTESTDHSREHVPLLVYGPGLKAGVNLGLRSSFADVELTLAEYLGVQVKGINGQSFYSQVCNGGI
jgi:phosphopentomutase